jgi:putative tricarboxylic transport membrane protein
VPEGVIAAEASNNASYSGALLPTLTLGIPGSAIMAVLLGAFVLHGLTPGPLFIEEHMDIVFAIIFGLVLGNLFSSTIGLLCATYLGRLTRIPVFYIGPVILVLCLTGSFAIRQNIWDVILAMFSGLLGYGMLKFGFSIVCLVIGYVLGVIAERAFHMSLMISRGSYDIFFSRPISLILFILVVLLLLFPLVSRFFSQTKSRK